MYILSYELTDEPRQEYEVEFDSVADAERYIRSRAEFMVYADVYSATGKLELSLSDVQ